MFDSGEPFGLPKGTVRGLIALLFAATIIKLAAFGDIDPITFLAVAGPIIGQYGATRAQEPDVRPKEDGPLAAPATGDVKDQ